MKRRIIILLFGLGLFLGLMVFPGSTAQPVQAENIHQDIPCDELLKRILVRAGWGGINQNPDVNGCEYLSTGNGFYLDLNFGIGPFDGSPEVCSNSDSVPPCSETTFHGYPAVTAITNGTGSFRWVMPRGGTGYYFDIFIGEGYDVMQFAEEILSAAEIELPTSGPLLPTPDSTTIPEDQPESTVTAEYIYNTYGIRVEDSVAGDPYGQKAWSEHELSLLNDVLKEIPPDLLKNMALTSFVRNQYDLDENGNQDPHTFAAYFCCGSSGVKDTSGASAAISVYDHASSPYDFTNDPAGDTQFKASILHEMIHAMQYRKDQYSVYDNPYKSPLVQTYMDATTPLNAVDTAIWENGWTYFEKRGTGTNWKLWSNADNKPPTDYGLTNPKDDMCESVMIYVYDPQRLKDSSMLRYNFIKDQMFGGIEYENGIQKP